MVVDYTITVGNLIEIGSIVLGGLMVLVTLRSTVADLQTDVGDMKKEIKKVGDVLVQMAVTSTRLDNVEQDIRDLKHGRGFIQPRSKGGIDGEYS